MSHSETLEALNRGRAWCFDGQGYRCQFSAAGAQDSQCPRGKQEGTVRPLRRRTTAGAQRCGLRGQWEGSDVDEETE
jgi:hypothetical protein